MKEIQLLLVEDDPMVMEVNKGFIQQVGGFKVIGEASTGQKALAMLPHLHPQLTIVDVYLPDISGAQIVKEIREMGIATDIIMITAAQDVETVQKMLRYGVMDYVVKPFKFARLKASLEKYKNYVDRIRDGKALDQKALDQMMYMSRDIDITINSGARADWVSGLDIAKVELPKGLREITLQQVLYFLNKENRACSAEEVAEGIGLARVTARRYLDYLERIGKVRQESRYGTVGRPINKYSLL